MSTIDQPSSATPPREYPNAAQAYKIPDSKTLAWRFSLELSSVLVIGLLFIIPHFFGDIEKRGFFCDDESLKHPFREETIRLVCYHNLSIKITFVLKIYINYLYRF